MDLANAALLIATVIGLVSLARTVKDGTAADRWNVGIVLGMAIGAVFLVGATAWAHTQVIGDVRMDDMSVADKVLVALFAAGAASTGWETIKAVKNIGVPMPSKAQQDAIDTGAEASLARWAYLGHDEAAKEAPKP